MSRPPTAGAPPLTRPEPVSRLLREAQLRRLPASLARLRLHHASTPDELAFLCDEVWGGELADDGAPASAASLSSSYGLSLLQPGDAFLDVGANVGLATLFAAERVRARTPGQQPGAVIALEPGPRAQAALRANARRFLAALVAEGEEAGPGAEEEADDNNSNNNTVDDGRGKALLLASGGVELSLLPLAAVALGSAAAEAGAIGLTTWPRAAGWATTVSGQRGEGGAKGSDDDGDDQDDATIERDMLAFLRRHVASVANGSAAAPAFGSRLLARAGSALARRSPRAFDAAASLYVRRVLLSGRERAPVAAAPLSAVLRGGGGGAGALAADREIAVLKVDVEGSELEVLRGVSAEDWPRVRRVVVEARGGAGCSAPTLDAVSRLLREQGGFSFVEVAPQAPALLGTSLYLVAAER